MKLALYNKKRNFKKTPEPSGKVSHQHKNLFIIQKHAASHLHYDFRLELNGVLLSWAVPKGPCFDPSVKRLALHVEDHPVEYGHFEGIIPKGEYGGGTVMLWDEGKWLSLDDNPSAAYKKGHLRFILNAKKLKGRWNLIKLKDDKSWFLIKSKDEYARDISTYDITLKQPNSVLSGLDLNEIAHHHEQVWSTHGGLKKTTKLKKKPAKKIAQSTIKLDLPSKPMPRMIYPQLATLVNEPPNDVRWVHELKLDGYRILAFKNEKKTSLVSRNHREWTQSFLRVAESINRLSNKKMIFDGEIVLLDKHHKPDFQLLQNSIGEDKAFTYYIFDLLYYDKYDLRPLALIDRKRILKKILSSAQTENLIYNEHIEDNGLDIFKEACEMGFEGIISKQAQSTYQERRTKTWLKIKCVKRQEFVIGGFSLPKGSRGYFGSLYLGYYNKAKQFTFCGNVGTGFNEKSLKMLHALLKKNIRKENPFSILPPGGKRAIWVKPQIVVEVEFTEWTKDGILRHPSYKGMRKDKAVKNITREVAIKTPKK